MGRGILWRYEEEKKLDSKGKSEEIGGERRKRVDHENMRGRV